MFLVSSIICIIIIKVVENQLGLLQTSADKKNSAEEKKHDDSQIPERKHLALTWKTSNQGSIFVVKPAMSFSV